MGLTPFSPFPPVHETESEGSQRQACMNELQPTYDVSPFEKPAPLWRFSLIEMIFLTSVVAMCSACWRLDTSLGIMAFLLFLPATLQTMRATRLCRSLGISLSLSEHLWNFCDACLVSFLAMAVYVVLLVLFILLFGPLFEAIYRISHYLLFGLLGVVAILGLLIPIKIMNHLRIREGFEQMLNSRER